MNFEKSGNPIKSLDIGWNRKLRKGDKFILVVLEMTNQPEREFEAIAKEDETSHDHWYTEKSGNMDCYETRQVKWHIPETAQGYAEMRCNDENPRWIFSLIPII